MQAIQEVAMAEKWVRDARNKARVKANLRVETDRTLGPAKQKNQELTTQLIVEERAQRSAVADLQNAQDQAEDQRKKLYHTKIELATLELKTDL